MQLRYEFPGIIVVSANLSYCHGQPILSVILKNSDEEDEGYVKIDCTHKMSIIDRYYLQQLHQSHFPFDPLNYAKTLTYLKDCYSGQALTRYYGQTQLTLDNGEVVDYPMFKVDEDMAHAVETICQDYVYLLMTPHIIRIQKHVRGYLSRRRYNFNKSRALVVKEIKSLPPGAIYTRFPGGKDYLDTYTKWTAIFHYRT
jgi:hypothetical protein